MKSSSVSPDDERRVRILNDLASCGLKFLSVAVDKRAIFKDSGLIYKQPFLKFINGILLRKLFETFSVIDVVADEHGRSKFMDGFVSYVKTNYISDLFNRCAEFTFRGSRDDVLIQTADIISGSLARVFDPKKVASKPELIANAISPMMLSVDEWPPKWKGLDSNIDTESTSFDDLIKEQSFTSARRFVEENMSESDLTVQWQVETVKYLIFSYNYINPQKYVFGDALRETVAAAVHSEPLSQLQFRSNVIAKLRDADVLIASSQNGYKIPGSLNDILQFLESGHNMIGPMVARLEKARSHLRLASKGQLDILSDARYSYLKQLSDLYRASASDASQ